MFSHEIIFLFPNSESKTNSDELGQQSTKHPTENRRLRMPLENSYSHLVINFQKEALTKMPCLFYWNMHELFTPRGINDASSTHHGVVLA